VSKLNVLYTVIGKWGQSVYMLDVQNQISSFASLRS